MPQDNFVCPFHTVHSHTLISVTGSDHVKYMATPFFDFYINHLPGFVTVEMPCTSDTMTGLVNPCQMIGICVLPTVDRNTELYLVVSSEFFKSVDFVSTKQVTMLNDFLWRVCIR